MIEDDPESGSPEIKLFMAITDGNGARVAGALGSLEPFDAHWLELFAGLLEDLPINRSIFPRRLILEKRTKDGQSHYVDASKLEDIELGNAKAFFEAIAKGDTSETAKELRLLKTLEGIQLELFTDLFHEKSKLRMLFPWWLKFKAPHAGRPVNPVRSGAEETIRRQIVDRALATYCGKNETEAAVQDAMTRTGKSRSTVWEIIKRIRESKPVGT